jgi:N-acylneuraminate cytidylyltransferase/CMP-N,N'-diacetyllegionaminic acid synthase
MINNKTFLAIIPARKGSKGVPGKNIKEINGKPLISLSIQEARKSKYIDKLIVTTNSQEIANIAIQMGAEVPFLRPEKLAKDDSSATSVILHSLEFPSIKELNFDYFIYLQPTSPFRTVEHIDSAIENIIKNNDASSLVSVCSPPKHPYWMKLVNQKGFLEELIQTEDIFHNRQELPDVYAINGAIYICKLSVFLSNQTFYKGNCIPFIMSAHSSIDIDNKNDWDYADFLFKNRK